MGYHFVTCICIWRHKYCVMCSTSVLNYQKSCSSCNHLWISCIRQKEKLWRGHQIYRRSRIFQLLIFSFMRPSLGLLFVSRPVFLRPITPQPWPWRGLACLKKRTSRAILISAQGWSCKHNSESFYSLQIGLFLTITNNRLLNHYSQACSFRRTWLAECCMSRTLCSSICRSVCQHLILKL